MLWVGVGGHRSLLICMVWVWVQIQRKCWALLLSHMKLPMELAHYVGGGKILKELKLLGKKVVVR